MQRLALALIALLAAGPAAAQTIAAAEYSDPTSRYPHGVLGDDVEWGNLRITVTRRAGSDTGLASGHVALSYEMPLPPDLVFEDTAPRLWDVTGDGDPEVVVVQSHARKGARLLVIGLSDGKPGFLAATPFIGERNRWLAPVGAADLDGDGEVEIAYVDRPHLARVLRIVRLRNGALVPVAELGNLSNHRIGETDIGGGVRFCGESPEMILADGDWQQVMAVRLTGTGLVARPVGRHTGRQSLARALECKTR